MVKSSTFPHLGTSQRHLVVFFPDFSSGKILPVFPGTHEHWEIWTTGFRENWDISSIRPKILLVVCRFSGFWRDPNLWLAKTPTRVNDQLSSALQGWYGDSYFIALNFNMQTIERYKLCFSSWIGGFFFEFQYTTFNGFNGASPCVTAPSASPHFRNPVICHPAPGVARNRMEPW